MTSFVGDLWKKVGELKFNSKTASSFPFVFDEKKPIGTVGPFKIFEGQDFESSDRKEESIFRRITIFSCKEKMKIETAKRILKNLKTLRHPRMIRYIFSKENENEILVVTEWVEPFKKRSDLEWQIWGNWSVSKVYEFLKGSTNKEISIDENCGNLWITSSGEVKVALFNENCSIEDFPVAIKVIFPDALKKENLLVQLTETFDRLVTLSLGERVNLIKTFSSLPKDFLKFLVLPELVKSRKLIGGQQEISIEEILFLFVKGKELIGTGDSGVDDFMFLLSDFYGELLGRHATGQPIPLTICLLDQMGSQGICSLFTEKYAQEKLYPHVNILLGHPVPAVREATLKALQGLCDKLGAKTIGNDVLRQLARMQGDSEGLLRLKALGVLEGTVWSKIPDTLKAKICGPAVSRALSDSYPPCRRSGLNLLKKGIGLLSPQEIVVKLVPAVAVLLIEEDAGIRMEAFECMEKLILPTLKKAAANTASAPGIVTSASAASTMTSASTSSPMTSGNIAATVSADDKANNVYSKAAGSNTSINSSSQSNPPPIENITEQKNISNESVLKPVSGNKMKLGSIKKIV